MHINEVVNIVGLSRKSIRYYEDEGLINPKRNQSNDYREYTEEDIRKLKVIKFLRELNVPIRDLKLLNDGTITLQDCMKDRIFKISEEEKNYNKVKEMCLEIEKSNDTFNDIDITKYFQEIRILNKEGFTMNKNKSSKTKKIIGAVVSSLLFSLFFIFLVVLISYFQFTEEDKIPWFFYTFIMIIFCTPLLGVVMNLIARIKEILGGEEDEASKY